MKRILLLCLFAVGCATAPKLPPRAEEIATPAGIFILDTPDPEGKAAREVQSAVEDSAVTIARWGTLHAPVNVVILPDHASLERAIRREGYGWLRAWAEYDLVYIQSPDSWTEHGAPAWSVDELLRHELTHCLMFQQASDKKHWAQKDIPFWFLEGMASVTANQSYLRMSLHELKRYVSLHPHLALIADAEKLSKTQSYAVYSAAHHAFDALIKKVGDDKVRALLAKMYEGETFGPAFDAVVGMKVDAFVKSFDDMLLGVEPAPVAPAAPPVDGGTEDGP